MNFNREGFTVVWTMLFYEQIARLWTASGMYDFLQSRLVVSYG